MLKYITRTKADFRKSGKLHRYRCARVLQIIKKYCKITLRQLDIPEAEMV